MKGFYIENFVLRILFCVVGFYAIWFLIDFIKSMVTHEPFTIGLYDAVVPGVLGVIEAFLWKPKN